MCIATYMLVCIQWMNAGYAAPEDGLKLFFFSDSVMAGCTTVQVSDDYNHLGEACSHGAQHGTAYDAGLDGRFIISPFG